MRYTPLVRFAKTAVVAALFAASGYYTGTRFVSLYAEANGGAVLLLGLPFTGVCLLAMLRSVKALYIAPMIAALWPLASIPTVAVSLFQAFHETPAMYFLGLPVSGLLGAWLVATAISIEHRQIFSANSVPIVAGLGLVLGFAFVPGLYHVTLGFSPLDAGQRRALVAAFTAWQTAIGTYLYLRVRSASALHCA